MDTTCRTDRWAQRLAESDARWARQMARSDAWWALFLAEFRADLREFKLEILAWTYVFVAGGTVTIIAAVRLLRP
jgi:hypothetical protein